MFGLLTIDEGPPLSMTAGRAVAQLLLVWGQSIFWRIFCFGNWWHHLVEVVNIKVKEVVILE